MRHRILILIVVILNWLLQVCVGCRGVERGLPRRNALDERLLQGTIARYQEPEAMDPVTPEARNRLLDDLVYLTDRNYYAFESDFYVGGATFDTVSDLAILSLGAVGALIEPASVKSILAAVSAGLAGARVSVKKNFFQEQTVAALIAKMRAGRLRVLARLRAGQVRPLAEYGLSRGLADLEEYYNVGTIAGALRAIVSESGEEARALGVALEAIPR